MTGVDEADDPGEVPGLAAQAADQLPRIAASPDQDHSVGDFAAGGSRTAPVDDILAIAH
jgi:hypothetical protein